jgi:outer membrane protein OmpA-like peptidoglycan-associated protein
LLNIDEITMKKITTAIMLLGYTFFANAQDKPKGDLQVGINGGVSVPISTFKTLPNTKNGYYGGLFVEKYFKGNWFGLGLDARLINNKIEELDSVKFANGFFATSYGNKPQFQNYLLTFGPTFKFGQNKLHAEVYVRGGLMMQNFPDYQTSLQFATVTTNFSGNVLETINDVSNKANSWAGVGGLRLNYKLNKNIAAFAHVDYVQTFGSTFSKKPSKFTVQIREQHTPIDDKTSIRDVLDYYNEIPIIESTFHKSVNAGIGIKYIFSKEKTPVKAKVEPRPKYDELVKQPLIAAKDIQIVVKDKQTGIALSGVTIAITSIDLNEKSISDANGQAQKVTKANPTNYQVVGEKNGIKTNLLTLTEEDFKGSSSVIFKEIFHDDPRFTLIGETYDCNVGGNLSGISSVLTNTSTKQNLSQISDNQGKFIYQLDTQADFTVVANHQGKYSQTELVTTKGLDRSKTLYVTLKLGVCDLVAGENWVLKNIHYDFDKSTIRTDATLILDNVVSVLKQNPSLKIELSSHTDSRGNDSYNKKLSQQRADAAVNYLVNQGISRTRLTAKGYGETKLLNECANGITCAEEQHQANRRTEIKILNF